MNRMFYLLNCQYCGPESMGTLIANNSIDVGEKIILIDAKGRGTINDKLGELRKGRRITPELYMSNPGIVKSLKFKKRFTDHVLKISGIDWIHTMSFIKRIKNIE